MIASLHVATGGLAGALSRSRVAALALGPPLHVLCDRVPHEDAEQAFEVPSGAVVLVLLALTRGPLDAATLGAAAAAAPDLEHLFPRLRPRGRKLFHDRGWHRSGGIPVGVQLVLAGGIVGLLLRRPPRPTRAGEAEEESRPSRLLEWAVQGSNLRPWD